MKSDETYLEAFIDHISNVPAELKRNLELMKDLDQTGNELFEEMTQLLPCSIWIENGSLMQREPDKS